MARPNELEIPENRAAYSVDWTLNLILYCALSAVPAELLCILHNGRAPTNVLVLLGVWACVCLVLIRCVKRGRALEAGGWFVVIGMGLTTLLIAAGGVIQAPVTATYLLFIISAGLFNTRRLVLTCATCSVLIVLLAGADARGLLPPSLLYPA